jgi:hypothetical protein
MEQRAFWRAMYVGAFAVLKINHDNMATELAELTRCDEDVFRAIEIMRTAGEGSRVWTAREWLRMKRELQ